jgi:hypothetical protein
MRNHSTQGPKSDRFGIRDVPICGYRRQLIPADRRVAVNFVHCAAIFDVRGAVKLEIRGNDVRTAVNWYSCLE